MNFQEKEKELKEIDAKLQKLRDDVISAKATGAQLESLREEKLRQLADLGVEDIDKAEETLERLEAEVEENISKMREILARWEV